MPGGGAAAGRGVGIVRRLPALAFALAALAASAVPARAQQPPARPGAGAGAGTVRGVVRGLGGEPIPYAVVALLPGYEQRFTDESGVFNFARVVPGTYRLLARQVGYKPRDSTIVVAAGATVNASLVLEHLTVQLEEIKVVAARGCTAPGPPDSVAAPDLAHVFDQLDLNAERYRLLAGSYPFHFRMERTFENYDDADRVVSREVDTLRYLSSALPSYHAGEVVAWGRGRGNERSPVLNLPTLADFADSGFQTGHCFAYAGIVDDSGTAAVRFEFRPDETIRYPDIEGWVDLDPTTYQVRKAMVRLTRPGRALEGLASASSVITFAELYPNIVVQSRVESENLPAIQPGVRLKVVRYLQKQRLLEVQFEHPLPGKPPAPGP